jgi:hypothetical protein
MSRAPETKPASHPASASKLRLAKGIHFAGLFIAAPLLGWGVTELLAAYGVSPPFGSTGYAEVQMTGLMALIFPMAAATLVVPWVVAVWYLKRDRKRANAAADMG